MLLVSSRKSSREMVALFCGFLREKLGFAEDQEVFVHIPERGVGRRAPGAPGGRGGGAGGFVPNDFAAHQETLGQHVPDDKGMEGNIRFAPQVGDVDAGPAAGRQHPVDLPPDPAQKLQVIFQGGVLVVFLPDIIRRRGHHQVDAVIRKFCHIFRGFAENLIQVLRGDGVLFIGNLGFLGQMGI